MIGHVQYYDCNSFITPSNIIQKCDGNKSIYYKKDGSNPEWMISWLMYNVDDHILLY